MAKDEKDTKAEDVQRWTAKRRAALVMSMLKGETSAQEAAQAGARGDLITDRHPRQFNLHVVTALRSAV